MWKLLEPLLSPNQYIPHGHCYLWQPALVWLHLISDLLTAVAYFSIPLLMIYFIRKRQDVPFRGIFVLFSAFIVLCGLGHLLSVWTLWHPAYWLTGVEQALTALVSCYTALQLVQLLPKFLALRTPEQLEAINCQLQEQIRERQQAEAELQLAHSELEARVEQRTTELIAANTALASEIQERRAVQSALQASQSFLDRLLNAVTDPIFVKDRQHRWTMVNDAFCQVLGHPREVLLGKSDYEFLPEAEAQIFWENDDRVLTTGVECENEETLTGPSGTIRIISTKKIPFTAPSGEPALVGIIRDITDRKRTEVMLRQQASFEQLISSVTRRIHESLHLQEILNTTVAEVRRVLIADRVIIYRLAPNGSGSVVVESVGRGWKSIAGIIIHDCYFAETYADLYRDGRVQAVSDIQTADLTTCHYELLQELQVRANLAVPITTEESLWGLLVAQQCGGPREWQPTEIELLKQLATQAAIAIQQSELYEQAQIEIAHRRQTEIALHQQAKREQLLNQVAQRIRQSLNLDEILNTTVAEVRNLLGTDRVIIYRFEPDWKGCVVVESVAAGWSSILGKEIIDPCFIETYVLQYKQGRIRATSDIYAAGLTPCYIEMLAPFQVRANLVVPILQGEHLWGLLIAHHCRSARSWRTDEVELLTQLATQVAIAIQQSELFGQVQQINTLLEEQVQERTNQLQKALTFEGMLRRITERMRDSLDEQQILQTAVQEIAQGLDVFSCDTGMYDLEQQISTISCEYIRAHIPPAAGTVYHMEDLPEIYTHLLQGHSVQFCPTAFPRLRPALGHFTIFACPLIDDQGVVGDMWLYRDGAACFDTPETELVQQVSNQCAIAIRQARLYQAAQAQVEELEKLNCLKDDFLSTVSHELRTPMSNIKMAIQMLEIVLDQAGMLTAEDKNKSHGALRYFKILQDECQREIGLINDLLDLTRLDAGTEPLLLSTIDPRIWIASIIEPFIERAQNQQQQLQIDLPITLPTLSTDLSCLERILTELLNNACKYTPAGEVIALAVALKTASLDPTVSSRSALSHFEIEVSNSGIELATDQVDRLFDKFYRVPNNDPWKHGGTGLGLALVQKLADHLGGEIRASYAAKRLSFVLKLPVEPPAAAQSLSSITMN